jgi:L-lactate dehydrogenase complex protein LldG
MSDASSRENILQNIRKALRTPVPLPFPDQDPNEAVYPKSSDDLSVLFASAFTRLMGKFAYCANDRDLSVQVNELVRQQGWKEVYCVEDRLRQLLPGIDFSAQPLAASDVSITSCESLVARTGTMVLTAALQEGRTASVYAPVHICVARTSQLVWDISDALQVLHTRYGSNLPSLVSFATGPSRTADIEKTLVVGVHGPKEVYCFLVEDGQGNG